MSGQYHAVRGPIHRIATNVRGPMRDRVGTYYARKRKKCDEDAIAFSFVFYPKNKHIHCHSFVVMEELPCELHGIIHTFLSPWERSQLKRACHVMLAADPRPILGHGHWNADPTASTDTNAHIASVYRILSERTRIFEQWRPPTKRAYVRIGGFLTKSEKLQDDLIFSWSGTCCLHVRITRLIRGVKAPLILCAYIEFHLTGRSVIVALDDQSFMPPDEALTPEDSATRTVLLL